MKRYRGLIILVLLLALCVGGAWLTLELTAQHPALGQAVSYPVNQLAGFDLTIEEPTWSPFRGYTLRYQLAMDSPEIYFLTAAEGEPFEYLEALVDGQWRRLESRQPQAANITFDLGGVGNTGFEGSVVQKYAGYGTRLDTGIYRLTLELKDQQGAYHYLAAEFSID